MPTSAGLIVAGSLAVLAAALTLGWPGRTERDEANGAALPADRYAAVLPALCRSMAAGRSGDVTAAVHLFNDTVHGRLHDLAAEAATSDRAAAARLLEAKQAVEHDLGRFPSDPAMLGSTLARLSDATRAALGSIGHPSVHVCQS